PKDSERVFMNRPAAPDPDVSTAHSPLANSLSLSLSSEWAVKSSDRFQLTMSDTWRMYKVSKRSVGAALEEARPLSLLVNACLFTGARFSRCTLTWLLDAYGHSILATSRSLRRSPCKSAQVRGGRLGSSPAFL